eukprot:gene13852-19775_t
MGFSKESLIEKLEASGVEFETIDHAKAMTADEQSQALSGNTGAVVKNLFLQDKKKRLFIISVVEPTKADLAVLSARMGLGKGGIKMAPAELIEEVLKVPQGSVPQGSVPQGSVSPLAVANVEGEPKVTLLLDENIRSQERVFVHPLVNTCSLSMSPAALEAALNISLSPAALESALNLGMSPSALEAALNISLSPAALEAALKVFGHTAIYVDIAASPKIDRENPPDLAKYVPAPPPNDAAPETSSDASTTTQAKPAKPAKVESKASKGAAKAPAAPKETVQKQHCTLSDVIPRAEIVIAKVTAARISVQTPEGKDKEAYIMSTLKADIEMQLNCIRNAAYAAGYVAGKGELVGYADKRYS